MGLRRRAEFARSMDDYRGLPGAFLFAFRRSDSHLLRAYVVTGALAGALVAVVVVLGLVSWLASPGPFGQAAFLAVIGVLVLLALFAPVLVVARRHRRHGSTRGADARLGAAGFGVLVSLFLALYISAPDPGRPGGPLGPAFAALDSLPRIAWVVPPLVAVAALVLAIRSTQPDGDAPAESDGIDESAAPGPGDDVEDGAER